MDKLDERMIKIYVALIHKGEKNISDVPQNLRGKVLEILKEGK